jgi:4Fe-4S iron-sulfur cluster binding domain/DR2241 stabilising domain
MNRPTNPALVRLVETLRPGRAKAPAEPNSPIPAITDGASGDFAPLGTASGTSVPNQVHGQPAGASRLRFGPVMVSVTEAGFELRNALDAALDASALRPAAVADLRVLATSDALGNFRPNKAAPNLVRGWTCAVPDAPALELALDSLLPGGLADWFAALDPAFVPTDYRTFAERQTGMYRNTASLSDPEACEVARACCDPRFCTRRRLWGVGVIEAETEPVKSAVPCLEPCALLLELARRAHRLGQEERATLNLGEGDLATFAAALDIAVGHTDPLLREGDLGDPAHPRRILLLREKLLPWLPAPVRGVIE